MDDNQIPNPLNETTPPPESETPVVPTEQVVQESPAVMPAYMDVPPAPDTTMGAVPETPILRSEETTAAALPPVQVAQSTSAGFSIKKVMVIFAGIALLGSLVAGSWYAYSQYAGEQARIALVGDPNPKKECEARGCNAAGYKWVWRSEQQECKVSNIKCGPGDDGGNDPKYIAYNSTSCGAASTQKYWDCAGCREQYPNGFCVLKSANETCYQAQAAICGEGQITGATCSTLETPAFPVMKTCTCAGEVVKFDRNGFCGGAASDGDSIGEDNKMGLCGVFFNSGKVCSDGSNGDSQTPKDYTACFSWSSNGLTINPNAGTNCSVCQGYKHTCKNGEDMSGGCNTPNPETGKSLSFDKECGYTQQIDILCGALFEHRSYHGPDCSPKPSDSTSASLACTSLTKDVATPTIGSVVTLTCAGSVAPAGATALTYKFRYNVNNGAWTSLANTTATTAQMTPNQCGTYSAQCQACGTINGSQVCDPVWTAATAQ